MPRFNRFLLAIFLGWLASSCRDDRIRGSVEDPFSQPMEGVHVQIDKSGFTGDTNRFGEYAIAYAPGTFNVRYSKEGFTTHLVPLSISQATDYPAADVVMFPIPATPGIFLLAKDGLVSLPPRDVKRFDQMRAMSQRTRYFAESIDGSSIIPPGKCRFIDTADGDQRLAKLSADGLIYDVTYHMLTPENNYADFIEDSSEEIGEEKLTVRTADLTPGIYGWVTIGGGPVIASSAPSRECYIFQVSAGDQKEGEALAKTSRVSWVEALKRTMADMRSVATAWEARATDVNTYSITGVDGDLGVHEVEAALSPTYIRQFPANDAWSSPFRFSVESEGQQYSMSSDGADRIAGNDDDVCYRNGNFTQSPGRVDQE